MGRDGLTPMHYLNKNNMLFKTKNTYNVDQITNYFQYVNNIFIKNYLTMQGLRLQCIAHIINTCIYFIFSNSMKLIFILHLSMVSKDIYYNL